MKVLHNLPLANYTSLQAGGIVEKLIQIEPGDNLQSVATEAGQPLRVLGFGTNVLVSDKGLPGTVILDQVGEIEIRGNRIKADSGANWDELVQKAISNNLWGLEFTSGIPGGVGAAVAGGIAAYGQRVADRFVEATMLNTTTGKIEVWDNPKLGFDYRTSVLQQPANQAMVVLDATFELAEQPTGELEYESAQKVAKEIGMPADSLENRRKIIMETRRRAGSLLTGSDSGYGTAGSFFKNPLVDETQIQAIISHEELPRTREQLLRQNVIHGGSQARVSAAHVLLAAGFKRGQTWGKVRLHPDHILKLENTGGATAQEIYNVAQEVVMTVKQKLDVKIEPEVRFLGEF